MENNENLNNIDEVNNNILECNEIDDANTNNVTINLDKENSISNVKQEYKPLFTIVLPKRRTWLYNFTYKIRQSKIFQAFFGEQTKALPAPSQFRI